MTVGTIGVPSAVRRGSTDMAGSEWPRLPARSHGRLWAARAGSVRQRSIHGGHTSPRVEGARERRPCAGTVVGAWPVERMMSVPLVQRSSGDQVSHGTRVLVMSVTTSRHHEGGKTIRSRKATAENDSAKIVIFAPAGQAKMAEALAHATGVHDTSTVTYRGRTRHIDTLFATIQASAWRA